MRNHSPFPPTYYFSKENLLVAKALDEVMMYSTLNYAEYFISRIIMH